MKNLYSNTKSEAVYAGETQNKFQLSSFVNEKDDDETVVVVDGFIGRDYFEEFMTGEKSKNTADVFRDTLANIETSKIRIDIHSGGGSLTEALVIYDLLRESDKEITTRLQGLSASAATLIALAGDDGKRYMSNTAMMLIHRVMMPIVGYYNSANLADMLEETQELDKMLINLYATRSNGKSEYEDIKALMNKGIMNQGTYIDAQKALDMGLVDVAYDPDKKESSNEEKQNVTDKSATLRKRLNLFTQRYSNYVSD